MNIKPYYLHHNQSKIAGLLEKVKVIYTDVDGTLLGPDGSIFSTTKNRESLYPAKALIKLKQLGVDVVMVSGRSKRQLFGDARLLGFKNYIAELGCQVVHNLGREVHLNAPGITENKSSIYTRIEESGAPYLLIDEYKGYFEYHTPWSKGRQCTHVFRGLIDLEEANHLLEKNGLDWLQVIDNGIIKRTGRLKKDIAEIHAYHILPKGAGKESGVRLDLKLRGCSKEEAMGLGDSLADLGLAKEVGIFFLMSNALSKHSQEVLEKLKQTDNAFVTPLAMNLGFAQAAFELVKAKSE
ncbi:hypothetical protein LCGC14_0904730 [marine sediment metagenome]|uniref:Sucrose phosphatase-like domain-containing protein n=1 Tax=marine sediment metagenome TaxID=412755 RepID=A0A0F9P003_9ZZZZ|nr:HAD family phosphatase [Actinomycetota bacterium]